MAADREADLLIVGAGPVGLYAAYCAGFRGLSVVVADSLPEPGGQLAALYPEKRIYDVPGLAGVRAQALVDELLSQAEIYRPVFAMGDPAERLEHDDDGVTVTTRDGARLRAKVVLITAGAGGFTPRRLPGAAGYEGPGLRYFVRHLDDLAGQDVVIVGGGDSAFDWALSLHPVAGSVTLVHRTPRFRAHEESVRQVREAGIRCLVPYEVTGLHTAGESVAAVVVHDKQAGVSETLPAQSVVAALGFIADIGPMMTWGLETRDRRVLVDATMRTNLRRVYAAGDVAEYDAKVRLIATGFGEAATAVNNAVPLIRPGESRVPGHSSDAVPPDQSLVRSVAGAGIVANR